MANGFAGDAQGSTTGARGCGMWQGKKKHTRTHARTHARQQASGDGRGRVDGLGGLDIKRPRCPLPSVAGLASPSPSNTKLSLFSSTPDPSQQTKQRFHGIQNLPRRQHEVHCCSRRPGCCRHGRPQPYLRRREEVHQREAPGDLLRQQRRASRHRRPPLQCGTHQPRRHLLGHRVLLRRGHPERSRQRRTQLPQVVKRGPQRSWVSQGLILYISEERRGDGDKQKRSLILYSFFFFSILCFFPRPANPLISDLYLTLFCLAGSACALAGSEAGTRGLIFC